jgi:hypothetical protein
MNNRHNITSLLVVTLLVAGAGCTRQVSFSQDVKPILNAKCQSCHDGSGEGSAKSGFSVKTYASLMTGTKLDKVLVPADLAQGQPRGPHAAAWRTIPGAGQGGAPHPGRDRHRQVVDRSGRKEQLDPVHAWQRTSDDANGGAPACAWSWAKWQCHSAMTPMAQPQLPIGYCVTFNRAQA